MKTTLVEEGEHCDTELPKERVKAVSSFHVGIVQASKNEIVEDLHVFDLTMKKSLIFRRSDEEVAFREFWRLNSHTQGRWVIWLCFWALAAAYVTMEFKDKRSWKYAHLEGAVFLLLIQAILSSSAPARWRLAVNKHYHLILTVTSCHLYLNRRATTSLRELLQSYDGHCDHDRIFCPNAQWTAREYFNTFFIVMVNNGLGMLFRDALLANGIMCLTFVPTFFPWGDRVDDDTGEVYTMNQVDSTILIPLLGNLLVMAVTLRRCYNQEVLTRTSFRQLHCLNVCRHLKAILMRSMIPVRFQSGKISSDTTAGGVAVAHDDDDLSRHGGEEMHHGNHYEAVPRVGSIEVMDSGLPMAKGCGVVSEHFPLVSVLVCSFPKEDLDAVGDPSMFVQLVATCVTQFDNIVQRRGLFKVEHIGESYVVSSPNVYYGVESTEHNSEQACITAAKDLVLLAHEFLSVGTATTTSTGVILRFRAAVHSGPITGVIAGRIRRFYRLVGPTLDIAGEMSKLAPENSVVVSQTTKEFLADQGFSFVSTGNGAADDTGTKFSTFFAALAEEDNIKEGKLGSLKENDILIDFHQDADTSFDEDSVKDLHVLGNEWVDALITSANQTLSTYTCEFKSRKVESLFARACQQAIWTDVKSWLLIVLFTMMCFISTLYTGIVRTSPSLVELLSPAVIAVVTGSALGGLFTLMHLKDTSETIPHHHGYMWSGLIVFGISTLLLMVSADTRFTSFGVNLFIFVRPEMSEHLIPQVLITFLHTVLHSAIWKVKWGGRSMFLLVISPIFKTGAYCLVQRCFNKVVRVKWTLDGTLEQKHAELDSLLKDLIPSSNARYFMLQQQLQHLQFNRSAYNTCSICITQDSWHAVVMSTDIVNYAQLCQALAPHDMAKLLHDLWCNMDSLVEDRTITENDGEEIAEADVVAERPFKMDIVGRSYVVVELLGSTVSQICAKRAAKAMLDLAAKLMTIVQSHEVEIKRNCSGFENQQVQFRMGLSLGEVIAGVIGFVQPRYHLYGKAVKQAFQMESQAQAGCAMASSDIMMALTGKSECQSFDLIHQHI